MLAVLLILSLEQLVTAINALLSFIFPALNLDHIFNKIGITLSRSIFY
jgi:hypothetical protein